MTKAGTRETTRWGTIRDAEMMCHLSRWSLWRMGRRGDIRIARWGNTTRIDLDSLDAFLQSRADEYTANRERSDRPSLRTGDGEDA
jgi:hypothetical protein